MLLMLAFATVFAGGSCKDPAATESFTRGFAAMQEGAANDALGAYLECLQKEPSCVSCQYEIGWAHWKQGDFAAAEADWNKTLALDPANASAAKWAAEAKVKAAGGTSPATLSDTGLRIPIGTKSKEPGPVHLELVARFQNYDATPSSPMDHYDPDVNSPKSARFSQDGSKVYVNSLEGYETPVYDTKTFTKLRTIEHKFDKEDAPLFHGETTVWDNPYHEAVMPLDVNVMMGKPVESALSHNGRYLWIPYYRRDFDRGADSPSALSVIDTTTDTIVRVFPTGPLPKYVVGSPDGQHMAVVHWGDNTVALVDITSANPNDWKYRPNLLVVEYRMDMDALSGKDRDAECGMCLRGAVFTPDSKTLLVARMGNGGIAGFEVATGKYLGTATGTTTPRHIVLSPDGTTLYVTQNSAGTVAKVPVKAMVDALYAANGAKVAVANTTTVSVGGQARTLEITSDGRWLFVASKGRAELVAVDAAAMKVVARVRTDSYTVGLDVSPDGSQVWTTSQGAHEQGGNSVCVFKVTVDP